MYSLIYSSRQSRINYPISVHRYHCILHQSRQFKLILAHVWEIYILSIWRANMHLMLLFARLVNLKSRKGVFRPFFNRNQKKLFYSNFQTRPKYYESSQTECSDSTSFINRLTPLFFRVLKFFQGLKGGFPPKIFNFFFLLKSFVNILDWN